MAQSGWLWWWVVVGSTLGGCHLGEQQQEGPSIGQWGPKVE